MLARMESERYSTLILPRLVRVLVSRSIRDPRHLRHPAQTTRYARPHRARGCCAHRHTKRPCHPYAIGLARAVGEGAVKRGIVVCDSTIGACIAANKIRSVGAGNCHDPSSAQQGVQNDLTWDLVQSFLAARFDGAECHPLGRLLGIDQSEEPEVHG